MEPLLDDLVHKILLKLAVQDSVSLLSATCSCKSLHGIVEANPSIWREAFLASATGEQSQSLLGDNSESALDAEVSLLGGYKRLALAKARLGPLTKPERFPFDQKYGDYNTVEKSGELRPSLVENSHNVNVARYLAIFKLQDKVLDWQAQASARERHPLLCQSSYILKPSEPEAGESEFIDIGFLPVPLSAKQICQVGASADNVDDECFWEQCRGSLTHGGTKTHDRCVRISG